ncbi:hypothetical protein Nepgr_026309 [Nepenthes gracilis]|uniref:PWWP domain-containing protein n=1 Tax=Nepenthes gracilis TaxID=150966 RepID=A0AAD3Y2C5_NEPGR|nr:hypothetical protein Nepgr_026309 [Nepenthes gracilis]
MQQKPVSSSSENFPRAENVEKPAKTKTLAECYEPHSPVDKAMREASRSSDLNSLSNAPIGENRANGVRVFDGKRAASLMDGSSVDGGDDMGMTLTEFSIGKNVGSQLLGDLGGDGINKNSEMCVANVVPVDNLSGATGDCLSGKVDSEDDGDDSFSGKDGAAGENLISGGERDDELKIEFKTGRNLNEKVSKNDSNVNPDEKIVDICNSAPKRLKNRVLTGRKEETKELNAGQNVWEMEDGHGGHGDTKFAVGDFVWGKIKSHPWWPGRIFDPSNASEFALTYKHEGRLLVAYFGDGTFAWCKSQQLKSFAENFEEMSKQSSSKRLCQCCRKCCG